MPIYAYACGACGHAFDALQKSGAAALTDCPECGAAQLRKQLSAPAFHLKGKGWRKSDDRPKKPDVRPRFLHTLDSGVPHAEHHDHAASTRERSSSHQGSAGSQGQGDTSGHGHSHAHGQVHSHAAGHSHSHDHGHGHSHEAGHGHKVGSAAGTKPKGGLGKLVQAHVESAGLDKSHGHSHDHSSGHSHAGSHSHGPGGHTHGPKIGRKPRKSPSQD